MRSTRTTTVTLAAALTALLAGGAVAVASRTASRPAYPDTPRGDTVDVWHGTRVPDPYRWLEQDPRSSSDVASWIAAENKVTAAWLAQVPERAAIHRRLEEVWNFERTTSPRWTGGRWFYTRNTGLQNQSVLMAMTAPDAAPATILDPNAWSADGTVALAGWSPSDDGHHLAYARSAAGSDWREWRVRDLDTGKDLDDVLQWTKFTEASWTHDGGGFFYSRYDAPPEGQRYQALNKDQKLCFHRLGTPQRDDVLVYYRPDQPDWDYAGDVTEDGRYLVITVHKGTDPKNRVLVRDLSEPYGMPAEIVGGFDNEYAFLGNDGPVLYFKTDLGAPRGRLISIDLGAPDRDHWRTLVPEAAETIRSARMAGDDFVVEYLKDAVTQVRLFRTDGTHVRDVTFPGLGTASGFEGKRTATEVYYTWSSFSTPSSVYRYDLATGASTLWRRPATSFKPDDYVVRQVFYASKDGTRVPMFIAHRKDVKPDGNRPTLLTGYGGFRISLTPTFLPARLAWMEMGGVLAQPNLRGGGEYGEEWHRAGTGRNKQNVFDDFIAAAEWLVANGYTKPARLAIQGGSNGGLLVGACLTQRPELFGATLPAVGVMDMLRFQKFTAGRYWVDDYGSADDPEMFPVLMAYSPYHNLKPGVKYPPTLITTADTDDRVIPGHSFKFAAAMQADQAGDAPVLIRIEAAAGHGGGKPTGKQIEETTDQYAFLVRALGMKPAIR